MADTLRPEEAPLRVEALCASCKGRRANNEDNFCVNERWIGPDEMASGVSYRQTRTLRQGVYAVFDGVGGDAQGELAAAAAARYFAESGEGIASGADDQETLREAFRKASNYVRDTVPGSCATAVVLCLNGAAACVAHAGDSRCYLLRDGCLECLTLDHVPDTGGEKRSHMILRYLGAEEAELRYLPDCGEPLALEHGDRFLLCSDGVSDALDAMELRRLLAGGDPEEIINQALAKGAKDNLTALVVTISLL